jgi:hypothetical protein
LVLKDHVGEQSSRHEETADAERVEAFRQAVGALGQGVPPTYVTRCRVGEFELMQKLGIQLNQLLHGEQEYSYEADIEVGDQLSYTTRLAEVLEKRELKFLVFETEIEAARSGRKARAAVARTTVILRGAA